MRVRALLPIGWLCLSCSPATGPLSTTDAAVVDTDTTDTADQLSDGVGYLRGVVQDLQGVPLAGADVQYCHPPVCRYDVSQADGSFDFGQGIDKGLGAFWVHQNDYIDSFAPFELPGGHVTDLVVPMHPFGTWIDVPDSVTEFEPVPGFFITLGPDSLQPPNDVYPPAEGIAVAEVTDAPLPISLDGEVLAVWYMYPIRYLAPEGLALRLDDRWAEDPAGLEVHVGSYETYSWTHLGPVERVEGSLIPADPLPRISTVVLLRVD